MGNIEEAASINPLEFLDDKFSAYIEDRRTGPRDDTLGDLPRRPTPTARYRRSPTSSAPRPSSSGPGDDGQTPRCCAAHPVRPSGSPTDPARRPASGARLHRGDPATGESGEDRLPAGAEVDDDRRRRHSGRHGRDGLARGREPRPRSLRVHEFRLDRKNAPSKSPSPAAFTPAPVHRLPESKDASLWVNPGPNGRHHHRRGLPRSGR